MNDKYYSTIVYCDSHGQIVDGEVKTWDSEDNAYAYLFACKEDDKYFADGAVVEKELPCCGCPWLNWWGDGDPATHCENGATPSPWHEAARWGGLPGCPQRDGVALELEVDVEVTA